MTNVRPIEGGKTVKELKAEHERPALWERMFGIPDTPLALPWDEWDEWEAEARKKYPFRWFMSRTLTGFRARTWRACVHEPWYWLKCRVWHRYNVVVCRSLPPTWVDRDTVLMHAAFQCLVDFIEKEKPWEFTASDERMQAGYADFEPKRINEWKSIRELYFWWMKRRNEWGDELRSQDQKMLHRLVDVRELLWT